MKNVLKAIAPYQLFFSLGLLNAILAVGVWWIQDLNWFDTPTMFIHSKLIAGGFLWSFITGFLLTAIPRMTGTASANPFEHILAGILLLGMTISSWWVDPKIFYSIQIAMVFFLITYAGRRIMKKTKPLPVFFSHVGIATVLALLGSYFLWNSNSYMGIHLYHVGTTLLLVLGIGTRFFSFLSGLPSDFETSASKWSRILFHTCGVLTAVLLYLAGTGRFWAYLGLTLVSLIYLFRIWKVQRASNRPSALKYGMRFVAFSIPICFFMTWLQPYMYVTWFHILFIGCFGLITFSVATRVTLAHGSYSTDLEMRSSTLWYLVIFLVLGSLSRLGYGFSEALWRKSYLHLAATFWVLAVIFWCWTFLPRIFKPGPQAKPSC